MKPDLPPDDSNVANHDRPSAEPPAPVFDKEAARRRYRATMRGPFMRSMNIILVIILLTAWGFGIAAVCATDVAYRVPELRLLPSAAIMTSNPLYVTPAVMVLYRADQAFSLHSLIPRKGRYEGNYDMVIAAQPYRSRMSADFKVSKILSPLARSLDIGTSTLLAAWNAAVYVAQIGRA